MENKILEILSNRPAKKDWSVVEQLEKELNIGISVDTKQGVVCYKSKRNVQVKLRIINKDTIEFAYAKNMQHMVCDSSGGFCVVDEKTQDQVGNGKHEITMSPKLLENTTIQEEYNRRQKQCKEICEAFGLEFKSNSKCDERFLARSLAHNALKKIHGANHVLEEEAAFINGSVQGGLMTCLPGETEEIVYDYDINSFYASLMLRNDFKFPMSCGIIQHTAKESDIDTNVCAIYKLDNVETSRFITKTKNNYYTNYHIELFKKTSTKFTLSKDKKNSIIYPETVNSCEIFDYFNKLYELKQTKGNKLASQTMKATWGVLSKKKQYEIPLEDLNDSNKHLFTQIDINRGVATMQSGSRLFKYNSCRIKSFLLSFARLRLNVDFLIPIEKKAGFIYHVNTDGFICDLPPENFTITEKLGDLKLVQSGICEIVNIRNKTFF